MKKFALILFLGFSLSLFGEPITIEVAEQTAISFLEKQNSSQLKSASNFQLIDAGDVFCKRNGTQLKSETGERSLFLFNISEDAGFIIVSGDNAVYPILGYSNEGAINVGSIPSSVMAWLEGYREQIVYVQKNNILPSEEISQMWEGRFTTLKAASSVSPLCKTKWSQSPYYNDMCPYDEDAGLYRGYHAVTGCPATAMAQIMKYWEYPKQGYGFHSYNHSKYGTLSANFSKATYDWDAMPNEVTSSNEAVALLMYHCGVSVEMDYGPDGSGSYVIKSLVIPDEKTVEYALPTYFGYDPNINGKSRLFYSDSKWKSIIKDELSSGRPVEYAGYANGGGGHTWVCDGYDENDFFHMNWGWGGSCDGYYRLDNLAPGVGGTGAGSGSYNSGQEILVGIKPAVTTSYSLILYNDVKINSSSIEYADPFTISVNLKNNGDNDFYGDYAAAIFDQNDKFVDFVEIKENRSLQEGYHYSSNLEFSTEGMLSLYPGTYSIYICYRSPGSSWSIIGNSFWHNYNTHVTLKVKPYTSDITLYEDMTVVSERIYSGDKFEVNTDVVNYGEGDFQGILVLALLTSDLQHAYWVDYIEETLPSMYRFGGDGITFSTDSLEAPPGSYFMTLSYYRLDEEGNIRAQDLVGSTAEYFNPIEVVVKEKPLEPDKYENNNTIGTAFIFDNCVFESDKAYVETRGANIQNGSDVDYYAVELEDGYLYTISGTLQDMFSVENSKYTGNMALVYSLDGEMWSEVFDNDIKTFFINGGGILYLKVSSYFNGGHGTYDINLTIERTAMIQEDKYESNNSFATAYVFDDFEFTNGRAMLDIANVNIHNSLDIDFYTLQFEEGYRYSFYAEVIDTDTDSSNLYKSDVVVSYSFDGDKKGGDFDIAMEYDEMVADRYIYFIVYPKDQGCLGAYDLKVYIERDTLYGPDIYENNNRNPYVFDNIVFMDDKTVIHTLGANCHEERDLDIYEIRLDEGYIYTIDAKVNDAYSSENSIYTGDVEFVYSLDFESTSEVFDLRLDVPIQIEGGTPLYFVVHAIEEWSIGTYDLEIAISRELIPDKYEPNNKEKEAYSFSNIRYENNRATILIEDANIQNDNDLDFYNLILEDGYLYNVDIVLKDKYTGMLSTYTSDVSFQYSINGRANSTIFSDALLTPIEIEGGNRLCIAVTGTVGTYDLEVILKRVPKLSIRETFTIDFDIYPNPCFEKLHIKTGIDYSNYRIYDSKGLILLEGDRNMESIISLEHLVPGTYVLEIVIGEKRYYKKFVKL